ncbi:DUF6801 domain-containing protein [Actinocorallia longicatena]
MASVTGAAACLAAAPAMAEEPPALTLNYTCAFPLIGMQPLVVRISSNLPAQLKVGEKTPAIEIITQDTVSAYAAKGLTTMYTATLSGNASAGAQIVQPNGKVLNLTVPNKIDPVTLPATGAFDVTSKGGAPAIAFTSAGEGKVTVGDMLLTMTPKDKDGALTGLGTFESECSQDPGQNNVLATIKVGDVPAPVRSYTATGSAVIKAGGPGTLPLTGGFEAKADGTTLTGPLKLNPGTASLKAFGFLPLSAAVALATDGDTTGTLAGGGLTTSGKASLTVTSISALGVPIGGGETCRTTAPVDLSLSAPVFDPATGGTLAGAFTLPALANCGLFGGLVGSLFQGPGNTLSLTLKAS